MPPELAYLNVIKAAGVAISLADYRTLAALNRDDLVLFNEAEAQRARDEQELNSRQGGR